MEYHTQVLTIDCHAESEKIAAFIREQVFTHYRKRGIVIGLSGGVDSAVVAALSVRAVGAARVIGLILPEKESNPVSAQYARLLAEKLDIHTEIIDITSLLETFGVYEKRESIIRKIFPEFNGGWKYRLVMPQNLLEVDRYNIASLQVQDPMGNVRSHRLSSQDYLGIVAATDIKQRVRMIMLYYYAEKNNYIVAGTTNVPETVQGFFVKYGDGGVDIEPIAHLYKTQVYQLAEYLQVPEEIIKRTPSPDTYSMVVSDEELYFCLPYSTLDLLLYAQENDVPREQVKDVLKLEEAQIERAFKDFMLKKKATAHLRQLPPRLQSD